MGNSRCRREIIVEHAGLVGEEVANTGRVLVHGVRVDRVRYARASIERKRVSALLERYSRQRRVEQVSRRAVWSRARSYRSKIRQGCRISSITGVVGDASGVHGAQRTNR